MERAANPDYVAAAFKETMNFWRGWVRKSSYKGRWREMVNRSALTLKLLTYAPTGAVVAAPTFGLPEEIGGGRNWDYRFTWIRDASFTVYGLMRLGYTEEAAAFMSWIEDRCHDCSPDGALQIMYGLDGRRELIEETLPHWEGYAGSSPVRIGNGAAGQLQLDIYGELMDSVYLYNKFGQPISYDLWQSLVRVTDWLCANWQQPDEGIWEVRGGRREFLYSRLMAWVAVDRAVRLSLKRSFPAPLARWLRVRDEIYTDIYRNFWNADLRSFVQYKGAQTVDASTFIDAAGEIQRPDGSALALDFAKRSKIRWWKIHLSIAITSAMRLPMVSRARKGRSICVRSGLWNASRAPVILRRRASFSKRRLATPITSAFIRRNSVQAVSISEIFRRRSPIWR